MANIPLIVACGGIMAGLAATVFCLQREKFVADSNVRKKEPKKPTNFLIYNYFPTYSIVVDVEEKSNSSNIPVTTRLVKSIPPKSTAGLTKDQVRNHLRGGNIIKVYVISPTGERKHFTDYIIDLDPSSGERIKALHVGMITTRFIGSTDGLRMATTSGNAISGNAFLRIHNLSYLPLKLNGGGSSTDPASGGGITISSHSTEKYKGYLHQGVTLGTIFSDDSGLYPDFKYLEPHSDLYYGVVSDIRQPLSGCWQLEYNDVCDYGQTMWPFQQGTL